MPRYHFHTEDGGSHPDPEGLELPDTSAAQCEAIKALGQLVEEWAVDFWETGGVRMTVTDERGLTLFLIDVSAVTSPASPGLIGKRRPG